MALVAPRLPSLRYCFLFQRSSCIPSIRGPMSCIVHSPLALHNLFLGITLVQFVFPIFVVYFTQSPAHSFVNMEKHDTTPQGADDSAQRFRRSDRQSPAQRTLWPATAFRNVVSLGDGNARRAATPLPSHQAPIWPSFLDGCRAGKRWETKFE